MPAQRYSFCTVLKMALVIAFSVYAAHAASHTATLHGEPAALGKGTVRTYVELHPDGHPVALGVTFSTGALEGLPTEPNPTGRCFDVDGNGTIDVAKECLGDYESILSLPKELPKGANIPFRWVGLNWNPMGHPPPEVYTLPHFDVHFYIMSQEEVQRIRLGKCGEFIDCEDFKRATKPVPDRYRPKHHINVDGAVPAMGNHLIDERAPEFANPPQKFTQTFLYGSYDGHITFYEPMITRAFLVSQPDVCTPIHLPEAWETSAYYPTVYCVRYLASRGEHTISLERFVHRKAE